MNRCYLLLAAACALALSPQISVAHEVQGMTHSHAFQQTGYGEYRVGHTVNGPLGTITIWSPQTYSGYPPGNTVKFARPSPITRAPSGATAVMRPQVNPASSYGKPKSHQE